MSAYNAYYWMHQAGQPYAYYWMHQAGQPLRAAVEAFLNGKDLDAVQLGEMRAYLSQWIEGGFICPSEFKARVKLIETTTQLRTWLDEALYDYGIDPL